MALPILHAFTIFSSFPIIIGDILQSAAVAIDQLGTDGGQFVKRIVHGDKISDNPGYLLFTAPYKLCQGGCEDTGNNFAMAFPIYVGKRGKEKYKELYERDYKNIRSTKPDAPFKKRPTKKLFTLCPSEVTKETTMATTETETTLMKTTVIPTTSTPTVSETETPTTDTPTVRETTTETSTMIPTTETPVSKTTVTEMMTADLTTETPTIAPTTNAPTTTMVEKTMTETEITTIKETRIQNTDPSIETTNIPTNKLPEVTETEDITFESYADDNIISEHEETTFVTNANGVRCPSRICRKKIKVTPSIVTLVRNNRDREKLDMRNAQWNSDYSDLQDYSDLYF